LATNLFDLTGRIALVTGASRGIGASIARLLAEQGAHVIVSSRKLDGAFTKTVEVNLRGYFFMSVEAGRLMKEKGGGAIVNTASVNALVPGPGQGIYSITKAAIVNMTKAFAKECAPFGIRVNALLPGLTKTKFAGALFDDKSIYDEWIKHVPLGRHARPDEMAGAVLYLVSDAATYTTGESLVVDGGLTI